MREALFFIGGGLSVLFVLLIFLLFYLRRDIPKFVSGFVGSVASHVSENRRQWAEKERLDKERIQNREAHFVGRAPGQPVQPAQAPDRPAEESLASIFPS